jgi:hypothetical protein
MLNSTTNLLGEYFKNYNNQNEISMKHDEVKDNFKIISRKTKNKVKDYRIIREKKNINDKTIEIINEEIDVLSNFFNIASDKLKRIYITFSGDITLITNYINKKISIKDMWSVIEDEIVLSNDLDQIDEVFQKRGFDSVMERRIFLLKIKND